MRTTALLFGGLLAVSAAAQTQIPISTFTNTYSYATHTRGYYFQAPASFVVTGLRVPDETMHGTQHVEVVRLSGDPAVGTPTIAQSLFYATGQPSQNIIPCSVLVNQGDWFGVLGACGDTTMMHNSYGASGFASNVNGNPVTLGRLMLQSNLAAGSGLGQIVYTNTAAIGRVEVYVQPPTGVAYNQLYGTGCYQRYASFFELFANGTFDLSNSSLMLTPTGSGYLVLPIGTGWHTPTSAPLTGLADDAVYQASLGFTLNHPAGSTTDIWWSTNGMIYGATSTNAGCCNGDPVGLLTLGPRWSPLWNDMNPSATGGGNVYFDQDPANGAAYLTFENVQEYLVPANLNTFQVAFFNTGIVEFRYQTCAVQNHQTLVGWSPGQNNANPGSIDISASQTILTQPDSQPLAHAASARPVMGTTISLDTTNVPAGTLIGATVFGLTGFDPGIDLSSIGAPGCLQYASIDATQIWIAAGGTGSTSFSVPATPAALAGVEIKSQGICLLPGANAVGVLTSNGNRMVIDLN